METPRFFAASITSPCVIAILSDWIALVVNAAVDHAAEMLGEVAKRFVYHRSFDRDQS
jgi:hypothetical protein